MKFSVHAALAVCALLSSYELFSAEPTVSGSVGAEPKPVPPSTTTSQPLTFRTGCYTNVRDCAGQAIFGPFPEAKACVLWKNDGQGGFKNFTLNANQSVGEFVGYNDTNACNPLPQGTPKFGQRWYCWVHP